jgi:hypothetical protein
MKTIGIVLLVVVAYFIWRFAIRGDALVLLSADTGKKVSASLKDVIPDQSLVIEIDNNDKQNFVTVISMPRELAESMGANPPEGFTVEPMPLNESEKKDEETVEYAKNYDLQTVRWSGNVQLAPDDVTELRIPVNSTADLTGRINFQYEAKVGFGGSISFFSVSLESSGMKK